MNLKSIDRVHQMVRRLTCRGRLFATIVMSVLVAARVQSCVQIGQKANEGFRNYAQKMYQIEEAIKKKRLTSQDKEYLLREVRHPSYSTRQYPMAILILASQEGLFSKVKLEEIIVNEAKSGSSEWLVSPALFYYELLNPGGHYTALRICRQYDGLTNHHNATNRIYDEEKRFILETISEPRQDDRARAGWIALQKHGLDRKSREWILGQLSKQAHLSHGVELEYWKFIASLVRFRSPGGKSP